MSFSFPWVLFFLPAAWLPLRRRRHHAMTLSSLAGWQGAAQPRRVRWLPALRILQAAAGTLLIVALAGPRAERPVAEEVRQGIAIQLLVDISSSMDRSIAGSDGQKTTRMEAAKETVKSFIANRPDDLIGLITFARYADTLSPLTFGQDALIQLVEQIKIQDRPNEDGTAYGDALMLACARLEQMNEWTERQGIPDSDPAAQIQSKVVILLTDGENNCGLHLPQEAAGLAQKWGIRIYAINAGGQDEPRAEKTTGGLSEAEQLLDRIAKETGGAFWKTYDLAGLDEAYAAIDQLEKSEIKTATFFHTEYTGIFQLFALPALILLLAEKILSATVLRVAEEISSDPAENRKRT